MRYFFIIVGLLMSVHAMALSIEDAPDDLFDDVIEMPPLPQAKEGVLSWEIFLATKEDEKEITFPDGGYSFEATPIFTDEMKALNGTEVMLHGFIFPLEQAEKQASFLIGPFPPSCPFHYHVPPTLIVEVQAKEPVTFSWDEITLKGTLELKEKDPNGVYYFLKNAELVE